MMNPTNYPKTQTGEVDMALLGPQVDWDNPSAAEAAIFSLHEPDYDQLLQEVNEFPVLAHIRWSGGKSLLHMAMTDNQNKLAEALVKNGADLNLDYSGNGTPLHEATESGNAEGVALLLQHNARFDTVDIRGRTPLHKAARYGDPIIIQMLFQHGAAINVTDLDGLTPLATAERWRRDDAIRLLKSVDKTS